MIMETLLRDIRYGIFLALRRPAFTFIIVLTLALGIGATTAIFSVINSILLSPLPYEGADRLVTVWQKSVTTGVENPFSEAIFLNFRDQVEADPDRPFENVAVYQFLSLNLTSGDLPERVQGATVTADFFNVFQISPEYGRAFRREEELAGANTVAVITNGLWKSRFGSDLTLLGKTISLNGKSYTVVGIMRPGFEMPRGPGLLSSFEFSPHTDILVPLSADPENFRGYLNLVGRLKAGVTPEQAQQKVTRISEVVQQKYPEQLASVTESIVPLQEQIVKGVRPALLALLAAAVLLLLIACTNVANLLLARASGRSREMAIRSALGASRFQVIQQLILESFVLALIGGVLGVFLANWGIRILIALGPASIPRLNEVSLDYKALAFALFVSIMTGLLFGTAPAVHASKISLDTVLRQSTRTGGGKGQRRTRNVLVITEIALGLVLLIGAGLLVKSFQHLGKIDPGFKADGVLTMQLALPDSKYPDEQRISVFFERVLQEVNSLPGVVKSGATNILPLSGMDRRSTFEAEDHPVAEPADAITASNPCISPGYLSAMNIPLLAGRYFTEQDTQDSIPVAVISKAMARALWPDQEAIGRRLRYPGGTSLTVVGVVDDVKQMGLDAYSFGSVYFPYTQSTFPATRMRPMNLMVRTSVDASSTIASIKAAIREVDADQPVSNIRTMEDVISNSVSGRYFNMLLMGIFAIVATLLACVGVYGLVSYTVSQRAREISIRMALGAQQSNVVNLIVSQAMKLALAGLALGVATSYGLTRFISSLLFGVSSFDPATFVITATLMGTVVLIASYVPALRASKVNPIIALKDE
jgi:putative ABC transport system permease protein